MALFDPHAPAAPARRRLGRGTLAGIWALVVALIALLVLTFVPTSFVIQRPGPVYDTLGAVPGPDGEQVPLISVDGAETYPTAGTLDLLTVQVVGNRERTPTWLELVGAWFDSSRAVVPIDSVFPQGQTAEEREQQNTALMVDSQQEATAAALAELGYDVGAHIVVYDVLADSAADGALRADDVLLSVDGEAVSDTLRVRELAKAGEGAPLEVGIERDGREMTVTVTPQPGEIDGEPTWLLGITTVRAFEFPFDVTIQLDNVGGPSAGLMFTLGIIDTLTPGELNGGQNVAGTGTIDASGTVGRIGGVRQKMYAAVDAGADYFLSPVSNCDEVAGNVPDDLRVFAVETLDDALAVMTGLRDGADLDALPTCATG